MTVSLPRDTLDAQNVRAAGIRDFTDALESLDSVHSFMLVRHGSVVAEQWWSPGRPDVPAHIWSLSKSFTSSAVGLAIAEGRLALTDRVVELLPDKAPREIDERLARLTVRDLLTMTTGHAAESLPEDERLTGPRWAEHILAQPLEFEPGTHFQYNSGATYLLSAILQSLTGLTLLEYLTPRLFEPLGIESPTWLLSPEGVNAGGWGLSLRTEDIAKFGQLYLRHGEWNGKRLIPSEWTDEATKRQVSNGDPHEPNDWTQGYGYQFWRCRFGAFRGDGKLGQFCVVMPDEDAVLVLTGDLEDMAAELNLVWKRLLPALAH
ncbi:MAG TPA: serine hydrolase [Galbitalea sp.]|nr:serine hydrolase [Galbitalea sp.]